MKRWGEKVTGKYKLDDYGFPVRPIPEKKTLKNNNDDKVEDVSSDTDELNDD